MRLCRSPITKPARAFLFTALWIGAAFLCQPEARAQVTNANVTLAVNMAQVSGTAISSDFEGLSFEMGSVVYDDVNNGWYLSGSNGAMIALAKTIGVKSIRVGGNSAELGATHAAYTPADEDAVLDYCHAIGANLIWDLEIDGTLYDASTVPTDANSKPITAENMHTYANSNGYLTNSNSLVFEVCNEPNLISGMTASIYDTDFSAYRTAMNSLFTGVRMAGPDTAQQNPQYFPTFAPAEAPGGDIAFGNQHLYPFGLGQGNTLTIAQEVSMMLAASNETTLYPNNLTPWLPYAQASGLPPRYGETNTFYHNGAPGASNAYAAALWGLGYMYYHASAGLVGVNFHMGLNANDPDYSAITPANVQSSYTVNPLAYGMAAFNVGGHGHLVPVTIGNSSNVNLVAYSVLQSDGSLILTVINRDYGSPASNALLSMSTSGTTYNDAQVMFLTGSNNDPTTLTGVTLGGSAISGVGVWNGTYMGMARPTSGSFALTLPIAQAAIIRLFAANGPAAPTNLSGTATNSQVTLSWTPSVSATSYTIERSSVTGGPYTVIGTGVTTNSFVDNNVAGGTFYYYVVAANNSNGVGPQSLEASVLMPGVPPVAPTGLNGLPGDSVVDVSWNAVAGATNYILESSTSSNGTYATIASTSGTSFLQSGLTDGKTYYYIVSAVSVYGQGAASAPASATPFVNPGVGWIDTVTSSAQSWIVNANWKNSGPYPNTAQSVALINSAIAAGQTIDVNAAITVGELDIGASGGGGAFTLAANGGSLTFQNAPAPGYIEQLSTSKGDTISAPLTITTNLNVSNASGNPLTLSGTISGTNNINFNGGTVILAGATTYSGTATVVAGTLELGNAAALQDSILNPTGGSVAFNGITSATLGGLIGTSNLNLVNTASAAVALSVGQSNLTATYAGAFTGSGSLNILGTGILTLTGASNSTGGTTVTGANLTIAGGTFGSAASTITVGNGAAGTSFNVTGGMVTAGTLNVAPLAGSTGDFATITGSGSALFGAVNIGVAGTNTSGGLSIDTSGTATLGIVAVARDTGAGAGLSVGGGTVTATSVDVQADSDKIANMDISGGNLTIGTSSSTKGFKVGDGGDGGFLTVSGGSVTYPGTDGLLLTTAAAPGSAVLTGGTTTLTGITMNSGSSTTATSTLSLSSGATLYLGSVGLVEKLPDSGLSTTFGTATIGAIANWSSVSAFPLSGVTTFQAGNALGAAYNITLSGALSGTGQLIKTGAGLLTLSGSSNYSGGTVVNSGTMVLAGTLTGGSLSVQSGGAFDLSGGALTAATTTISAGGALIDDGALTTALTNNGTVYANTGSVVTVTGSIVNNGTVIVTNGTAFDSSGTFTNNGILDIMTGWPILPPRFVNNGIVLTASVVKVKNVAFAGTGGMTIAIQTFTGHTYQLQSESSLNSTWTNVTNNVTTQTNGSGVMTFTLTNVTPGSQFYRIQVGP